MDGITIGIIDRIGRLDLGISDDGIDKFQNPGVIIPIDDKLGNALIGDASGRGKACLGGSVFNVLGIVRPEPNVAGASCDEVTCRSSRHILQFYLALKDLDFEHVGCR